jgi:hypothetical protein
MEASSAIFRRVQELIAPLDSEARLRLIEVIAAMPPRMAVDVSGIATSSYAAQVAQEQAAWYALPSATRARYHGEYVAVHQGHVVDHDPDQRALYVRVRQCLAHAPIALLSADWNEPPTFVIHSPRLERAE